MYGTPWYTLVHALPPTRLLLPLQNRTLTYQCTMVHPGTPSSTYKTSTFANPYSDIPECTIHVDIHYSSSVFVTTVFLKMDPRVRNMVMYRDSEKLKLYLICKKMLHFVRFHFMVILTNSVFVLQ